MSALLYRLYNALGLDEPEEDLFISFDGGLDVYFNESETGLEMCCPFMPLPHDVTILQACLRMNYAGPVIIGTDEESALLLALNRLPPTSSDEELLAGLRLLVAWVSQFREGLSENATAKG